MGVNLPLQVNLSLVVFVELSIASVWSTSNFWKFFFIFLTFVSRLLIPSMFCFTFLSILLVSCSSSCILMCVATFTHFCCSPKSSCNNCPFVDFINKVKIKMLNIPSFVELQIRFCKYFISEEKIICTILFSVHIYKKIKPLHALGF